jgi:hypothetical protein
VSPRGCGKTVCTRGSNRAPARGSSTSPLGVVLEAIASFLAPVGLPWRHGRLDQLAVHECSLLKSLASSPHHPNERDWCSVGR